MFSSAVNIWNWLACHLGRSGGKGHYQRDDREEENPVFFSFKKSLKKKKNFIKGRAIRVKIKLKSIRYSSRIHANVSMFLLSKYELCKSCSYTGGNKGTLCYSLLLTIRIMTLV